MDIQPIHTASIRPENHHDFLRQQPGAEPQPAASRDATAHEVDRVEISAAARAILADQAEPPDMEFARRAMQSIPPMSEERLVDLLQRIRQGYRYWPDMMERIVDRIQDTYTPGSPSSSPPRQAT